MILKLGKPYMVRNDGTVIKCDDIHPYILFDVNDSFKKNIKILVSNIQYTEWFLANSKQNLKPIMKDCFQELVDCSYNLDEYELVDYLDIYKNDLEQPEVANFLSNIGVHIRKLENVDEDNIHTCISLFQQLNNLCNQEFLRIRTGGKYSTKYGEVSIYFRISSFDFDWFPIIWKIVYENRNEFDEITITADSQSGKDIGTPAYIVDGKEIAHMPIDEFLMLKGNPIVEELETYITEQLRDGVSILKAFGDFGPFHNNRRCDAYRKVYIRDYFEKKDVEGA